jgi:hypothetical protein
VITVILAALAAAVLLAAAECDSRRNARERAAGVTR